MLPLTAIYSDRRATTLYGVHLTSALSMPSLPIDFEICKVYDLLFINEYHNI